MSCIAGTPEAPRTWVRFKGPREEQLEGRWCDRQQPFTSRRSCSSCPAYRGVRWDGTIATGLAPNGDIIALSDGEYQLYQRASDAAFEHDDFSLMRAFFDRLEGGVGERTMRENGDPDAGDRWAAYMREYRAAQDPDQRARQREATRERVRRWRAGRKSQTCNVSTPGTP